MDLKDLQRQVVDAERLADWGQILLSLTNQIKTLEAENASLKNQIKENSDGNKAGSQSGAQSEKA